MEEQFEIRLQKLQKLRDMGIEAYPYRFEKTHSFTEVKATFEEMNGDALAGEERVLKLAGRIVAIRKMGKSSFLHLFDGEEKLQIYVRRDVLSERDYEVFLLLDIGDHIGVEGTIFRTRSGELTLLVKRLTFLAKSFHPLPEKWHGLQDKELRFRQRYLDLIVNETSRRTFKLRSRMMQAIRLFFYDRGYTEVETPMMHPIPGGASARPFVTHHNALDIKLYLRIAPELYLKRLLVGGMEKVFEINRNFRNEGISLMHNPEFTMLEFYELYRDYTHCVSLTEELIEVLNGLFCKDRVIEWNGNAIDMSPPFERRSFMDLLAEKTGLAVERLWDGSTLSGFIKENLPGEELPPTFGKMLDLLFDRLVEGSLQNPTFVTDYPKAISPLSKVSRRDDRETERFELYIAGMEIANGFSELNDPLDQRRRFEAQLQDRERGDDEAQWLDADFLRALEQGMPPAAGEGVGIDRLVMLYAGAPSIKEVILFPLLRPKE